MKKLVARLTLGVLSLVLIGILLWGLLRFCIFLYRKANWIEIGTILLTITVIGCISYILTKIIEWAIDNA
jgi:hypothetical protein